MHVLVALLGGCSWIERRVCEGCVVMMGCAYSEEVERLVFYVGGRILGRLFI